MTIAIAGTRRSKDGLFARVHLGDDATDCTLSVSATTAEGAELPARVLPGPEEGDWLLVLPALSVTQVATLAATSWDGSVVEELTQKFNPLTSRINVAIPSLARRGSRSPLRLPDGRGILEEWDISVLRLVQGSEGQCICQGYASLVGAGRQAVEGALELRMLDGHGHDLALGGWTCLEDSVTPLEGHGGFFLRHVEFSVRIPSDANTIVVWVHALAEELSSGFSCLGPRAIAGLREAWKLIATPAAEDDAYGSWFATSHAARKADLSMQQSSSFDHALSFSVVSVLRGATPAVLREMVESVLGQSYGHLELVLVNAAPGDQRLASAVRGLELADARVRSVPLGADFGVAAATSEGIDAATGDFVCLLGEGDLLAPDALWCLASAISNESQCDLIYTDEDSIERGRHVRPIFKPDWDPDLLLGSDYLGGLTAVRKTLLRELGTMGRELDGAQAYHLALYASERARMVRHVPRVLYHAREQHGGQPGSVALASGLVALRHHLKATSPTATARASTRVPGGHEVSYALDKEPMVSIVVASRDRIASLDRMLESLRTKTSYERYEVIIVENGSVEPETFEYYRSAEAADERVRTIFWQGGGSYDEPALINFGASRAKGDYLVLMHNDVEVTDADWLRRLVSLCAREGTGAAGARLLRADGTIECSGMHLSTSGPIADDRHLLAVGGVAVGPALLHGVSMASGACLVVDKRAFDELGGLSAGFPQRNGDADLCLRLWGLGLRVVLDPQVTLLHHRPLVADEPTELTVEDLRSTGRLWESWPFGAATYDPTLNPNLDDRSAYRALPL